MNSLDKMPGMVEYRCVLLLRPDSDAILGLKDCDQVRLPRVSIPEWTRPTNELCKAIAATWQLDVFVLELWPGNKGDRACVVAELLTPEKARSFATLPLEGFKGLDLSDEECCFVEQLLEGKGQFQVSAPGWIDKAMAWIESHSGTTFSLKRNIAQWNAGSGFVLLRVRADDGRDYWLKATGKPNEHEFEVTHLLSELHPEFIPRMIQFQTEWNAWLMEDAGPPISNPPCADELDLAANRMSRMQLLSVSHTGLLLEAGALDLRLPRLRSQVDRVIEYLAEAMSRQTSKNVAPLSRDRLRELGEILHDALFQTEALGIPNTLLHNDLNPGNILSNGPGLVFIDWSDAGVGNPFIVCERLSRLNPHHRETVQVAYRHCWFDFLNQQAMESVLRLMPLIAIYACLYGRGEWLGDTDSVAPQLEGYRRSLARHMDRAAKEHSFLEALCH